MGRSRKSWSRELTAGAFYRLASAITIASMLLSLVGGVLPPPTAHAASILAQVATITPTPTSAATPTATRTATPTATTAPTPTATSTGQGGGGTVTTQSYDNLYQLTGTGGGSSASYSYDPVGNISSVASTTYSYDRADRITAAGATPYAVNSNGNLTARGTDSFTYDQANRLKTASVAGTSSTYAYDGDGKRASKTVGTTQTNYTYDVNASLPVLLDDGTRKYVWGLGLAYAVDQGGNPIVYHSDGLGSARALTDSTGSVVQTYQYDGYGNVLSSQGNIDQPFGYTGEQRDETGLTYLRARMYDPSMGRFLTRDPAAGGSTSDPSSLNRYSYARNSPTGFVDPSGMDPSGPPPVPVPGGDPTVGWKWNPNPNNPRGGAWGPAKPVKGRSQPSASWDPAGGHWDVDDGLGNRQRYDEDGNPIPTGGWHPNWNASSQYDNEASARTTTLVSGAAAVGTIYLAYRVMRFLPSLAPPLWWTIPANAVLP